MPSMHGLARRVPAMLVAAFILVGAGALSGQTIDDRDPSASEADVLATVDRLFDGMRARDGDRVLSAFHPEARIMSTRIDEDGAPQLTTLEVADFAAAVGQGGDPWNEPYWNPLVRVDGALAQVWIFYRFSAGGTFSHCGHNAIQLVRDAERGWEIASLIDSRRTSDCDPPDGA